MLRRVCVAVTVGVFMMGSALADLSLSGVFGNAMVLQRNEPIAVWGKAAPGESVSVSLNNQTTQGKADAQGDWSIKLPAMKAGGPYTLSVTGANASLTLQDVLIGDVWICSGQSNMGMTLQDTVRDAAGEQEVAAAQYPNMRLFIVTPTLASSPQEELGNHSEWMPCTPESVRNFSAAGYYFGQHLLETQQVPMGLVMTAWGGTYAETWTSKTGLATMPAFEDRLKATENNLPRLEEIEAEYQVIAEAWEAELDTLDAGCTNGEPLWSKPECSTADWTPIDMPIPLSRLSQAALSNLSGRTWLRYDVTLPDSWQGQELELLLGMARETGKAWFNGVEVSRFDLVYRCWDLRSSSIPGSLVKAGVNTIVVRLTDASLMGGLYGNADIFRLVAKTPETDPPFISIEGSWLTRQGLPIEQLTPRPAPPAFWPGNPNMPTVLYNAMIHPLIKMPIKGAIWYQGESNAETAYEYRTLFPTLIQDWRRAWGQGDFPFLFVQIADFRMGRPYATEPRECSWGELREAQLMALSTPNTAMAVSIDIGDPEDIHPVNKKDLGARLGLAARAIAYGEKIEYSGPIYKSMKVKKDKVILSFNHAKGLSLKGEALTGFEIAGADRKFVYAKAEIKGNKVVVWHDSVPEPVAVRYGWDFAPKCNLYNAAGLPASPFRTDEWPGLTAPKTDTDQ